MSQTKFRWAEPAKRAARGRSGLLVLPPDKGRKSANLIGIFHRGGGWYMAVCFGGARKCIAGECRHVADMRMRGPQSERPITPTSRAA